MNDKNIFTNLLDNIASKTVLALLTIVGGAITIYAFLQEKKVDLRYEIIANTNVLDFNAEISKLQVFYDSTDLKQTNENLRIYTVKVINNGDQNILKEYYDENDPVGLKLSTGKIIEQPEIIQASSDYLLNNLKISDYKYENLTFSQVIIESGEFFIIKFLVLHKKDTIPNIFSFGKIAGQRKINVVNAADVKEELSFWQKVYYGSIWVQLLRLLTYFIVVVIFIIIIVFISSEIDDYREKKRKLRLLEDFKNTKTYQYTRMDDAIFDRYKRNDAFVFRKMKRLIEDEQKLNDIHKELSTQLKSKEYRRYRRIDTNTRVVIEEEDWSIINEMIKDGIVFWDKDRLTVNQAMKDTIDKFVDFLKEKNEFKSKYHFIKNQHLISDVEKGDINERE